MVLAEAGVSVVISPTEELLVMWRLIVPCDLKKSVMWTCVFGCYNNGFGNNRFLAVGLGRHAVV